MILNSLRTPNAPGSAKMTGRVDASSMKEGMSTRPAPSCLTEASQLFTSGTSVSGPAHETVNTPGHWNKEATDRR